MKRQYTYADIHCPAELLTPKLQTVNPMCLDILYKRGFHTSQAMEGFLFPSLLESIQSHPHLRDMDKAAEILCETVKRKLPTVIYHDYDADGITAGAVAMSSLQSLDIPVHLYCNDRIHGGFGINPQGIEAILEKYPDTKVLVTVDNGITGFEGVAQAKAHGLSVIVTDHHEPGEGLPAADAVVDPKRTDEPEEQDRNCCGAGVIWKVMLNLYVQLGLNVEPIMRLLDLVTVGTVGDVVPLIGDNRAIVQEGLRRIASGARPFFRCLSEVLELQTIDSQTIGFKLAPMLNAASRMGHDVEKVVQLLLNTNPNELRDGILQLSNINERRKEETAREVKAAEAILSSKAPPAIVVCGESFMEGVVGIVAGHLKEEYGVPCAVFARSEDGNWKGSCRSPDGFHLKEALDKCSEYLISYGGHAKAAGATVRASDFQAFQQRFVELASTAVRNNSDGYSDAVPIDLVLPASSYTEQMVRDLGVLEPYGEGFPPLLFGITASIIDTRYMGAERQHVKYIDSSGLSIIQWRKGSIARTRQRPPSKFVGYPRLNVWNGQVSVQFISE